MTETSIARAPGKARMLLWTLAALAFCVPLVALLFDSDFGWTGRDFLFAAIVIGGIGLLAEGLVRVSRDGFYRAGAAAALAGIFVTVWSNAAVGIVGDGMNGFNATYMGLVVLAIAAAALVRFRAAGMAAIALAAVVSFLVLAVAARGIEPHIWSITAFLATPWAVAAALFWQAKRRQA